MRIPSKALAAALCVLLAQTVGADVKPAAIFNDNMVLQRDREVPVWGTAAPGEEVELQFAGQTLKTTADKDGNWEVRLQPLAMNKEAADMTLKGKNNTRVLKNIVVGDVWLCSGQSNMEMPFSWGILDGKKFIEESANYPLIRKVKIQKLTAETPKRDISCSSWDVCSPKTLTNFTATGYFFARKLYQELEIPIGLIDDSWSGSQIEPFIPPEGFRQKELQQTADFLDSINPATEAGQKNFQTYFEKLKEWLAAAEQSVQAKTTPRTLPPSYPSLATHPGRWKPTSQYNAMIAPITRFPIKGAIWYQGCSNGGEGDIYYFKMKGLIEGWRNLWGYDFPFYFVQLAAYTAATKDPAGGNGYAKIREAQRRALSIPGTGMATAIDIGDQKDIHPKNKIDVGERLALWALAKDYGKDSLVYSGPLFKSMKIENGKIRLEFDYADGLMTATKTGYAPPVPDKNAKPAHFAIAGADKKWVWADAVIDGNSILVSSPEVPEPVAVRYGFRAYPDGLNLYNAAGLPMVPFRTDNW